MCICNLYRFYLHLQDTVLGVSIQEKLSIMECIIFIRKCTPRETCSATKSEEQTRVITFMDSSIDLITRLRIISNN